MITLYSTPYVSRSRILLNFVLKRLLALTILLVFIFFSDKASVNKNAAIAVIAVFIIWFQITAKPVYKAALKRNASSWAVCGGRLYFICAGDTLVSRSMMRSLRDPAEVGNMILNGGDGHFIVWEIDRIRALKRKRTYSRVYFDEQYCTDISTKNEIVEARKTFFGFGRLRYADITADISGYDELMDILKYKQKEM